MSEENFTDGARSIAPRERTPRKAMLCASVALLLLLCGLPARALDIDANNSNWRIGLKGFFPPSAKKNSEPRDLPIFAVRRESNWVFALGSQPQFNTTTYPADVSALKFDGEKISGTLTAKVNPDPWIPSNHLPLQCSAKIEATLDRAASTTNLVFKGRYEGKRGDESVSGDVSISVSGPQPDPAPEHTLQLTLNHALIGGREPFQNRLAVKFAMQNGRATAAEFGLVGLDNRPFDWRPFDQFDIRSDRDGFSGEFTVPFEILGALGDNAAQYRFKISGKRITWLVGGEFTVAVRETGGEMIHNGNFKGSITAAEKREVGIWEKAATTSGAWFVPVKNFQPVKPGEHPRLFFRKSDLPEIKRRAETPEGKAIVARLRATLGGGEAMPTVFNPSKKAYDYKGKNLPEGAYTVSHAAGFGMLWQLTGDKKYSDLARKCFDLALAGQRDRDDRYSFRAPGGQLRAGPSLAWYALAYDLCYDAWPDDYRHKIALELQNWSDDASGEWAKAEENSMRNMVLNPAHMPASNHWGSQLGVGLVVLSLLGDPGTDDIKLKSYLAAVEKNMVRGVTAGFGDGGFFAEGPGPAHMMSNPGFVPLVQAMKVALGKDYITPRPNFSAMTTHWLWEVLPDKNGTPIYPCRKPSSYGNERFLDGQGGMSHGGWFTQGFGAIPEDTRPALLWLYNHFCAKADRNEFDTRNYPHRAILALVNWPIGVAQKNPAEVLPRTMVDRIHGHCVFRNRWQDSDDVVVSAWFRSGPIGHINPGGGDVLVWGMGERIRLGTLPTAKVNYYNAEKDGSGVVSAGGVSVAVDFSGKSGAPVLVAMAGDVGKQSDVNSKGTAKFTAVSANGVAFRILQMGHTDVPVQTSGNAVKIGARTLNFENNTIVMR